MFKRYVAVFALLATNLYSVVCHRFFGEGYVFGCIYQFGTCILLAKNHAGMLNDVKLTFFRSVGAEWSAPDDMEDSHYCDENKVLCVGGVVLGILSVLIADSQLSISVSGLWDVFNKNLGGPALVSPILFVVMFLLYERIDRFVLKVDKGDKSYERSGNMRLLGSVALGLGLSYACFLARTPMCIL